MPYCIYHGLHELTHSDFYYKYTDFSDPRAIQISWIIETEVGKQFGVSFGYKSDKSAINVMKKSIDGFISATPVYRLDWFPRGMEVFEPPVNYGFKLAGISVPEPSAETALFGGPALTVEKVAHCPPLCPHPAHTITSVQPNQ